MKPKLKLAYERPSERVFGSPEFIGLTRNLKLKSPTRFEPSKRVKDDDIWI